MSIALAKGQKLDLSKGTPLNNVKVALGWDAQENARVDFDLDASVFCCNEDGKCTKDTDFVFYNNLKHPSGAVKHTGDNLTGDGDGDDETILVDFPNMPSRISRLNFVVTIHEAEDRRQNFGQVSNAYVRLLDADKGDKELLRYNLEEDFSLETSVMFCSIYRKGDAWNFEAIGSGSNKDLGALARDHGLDA